MSMVQRRRKGSRDIRMIQEESDSTKITVVLEVDNVRADEEGLSPVGWAEQELGWLHESGISLVEIKE
jgi:hypothetical protein